MTNARDLACRYRATLVYAGWVLYTAAIFQFHPSWLVR